MNYKPEVPILLEGVTYRVGGTALVSDLTLTVEAAQTLVLIGRSGSGKTTALRLMNGLIKPTEGRVLVEGKSTDEWDPIRLRRKIGYVIQEVGLFPHFTVSQNVGLVPTLEAWSESDVERRTNELLTTVGLDAEPMRGAVPAPAFRWTAATRWGGARPSRRSAFPSDGRALRCARPHHAN